MKKFNIYKIQPSGYKPTYIYVKIINSNEFTCRFIDVNVINEFKATGFKIELKNGLYSFLFSGNLTREYVQKVWSEYLLKIDNPEIEFTNDNI